MTDPLGVMLMTYGSPAADLHDLADYLAAVRGGRPAPPELVMEFRRRYELIGGSPLVPITIEQATALENHLRASGIDARATVGMRFSAPTIGEGIRRLAEMGCARISAIVMSPQHSDLLMAGYRRAIEAALGDVEPRPSVVIAPAWYREPDFVAAVAKRIRSGLATLGPATPVLLTAHSLPRRVAEAEPTYLDQLRTTAELVAAAADLAPAQWRFCWQSAGHEPGEWMTPDFAVLLPELRAQGHTSVLVAPIQFLADHLEILYDVDVAAREQAKAAGMTFARIESLNDDPSFIAGLARVALDATLREQEVTAGRS